MDAIARHDARFEVWLFLKNRRWSGQNDVGEQDKFGVQPRRAVNRSDQRRFDVEDVHQDLSALAINLVITSRGEEVETLGADGLHKCVAATGQNDDAIVGVRPNRVKQVDELLVSMAAENKRAAIGGKRHFEYARFRPSQPSIGKTGAISIKTRHYRTST